LTEETKVIDEAIVVEVAQDAAPALTPPAPSEEASAAAISTEVPAADTAHDPSQNVITLVHDEIGIVPMTEPKTDADGDRDGHERVRVA
jgi:hypothetical protein